MATVLYFAYGSNLDVPQMQERCPTSKPVMRARLGDHRLDFTHLSRRWGGGAADILPEPGATVWGGLYQLDREEIERLDGFEGGYDRLEVRVLGNGASPFHAISYTVRQKEAHPPTEAYLDRILRWGAEWGLPESYLADLLRRRTTPPGGS